MYEIKLYFEVESLTDNNQVFAVFSVTYTHAALLLNNWTHLSATSWCKDAEH